jgi:uncharacterized protein (TIGR02118 family)
MVKLSVMYPYSPEATFDYAYYRDKHMPMLKELMGEHCRYYTIDKGVSSVAPGSDPAFIAMCHVYSDSLESLMAGLAPHGATLAADIPNFTNAKPVRQISEVVVERS